MDYMSRLYQNKAIQLQEQINFLERTLKQLAEASAWSPSSGGPAIPESGAGNNELKDRMRNIKQSGDRPQSKEYLEMEAELNRRTGGGSPAQSSSVSAPTSAPRQSAPTSAPRQSSPRPSAPKPTTTQVGVDITRQSPDQIAAMNDPARGGQSGRFGGDKKAVAPSSSPSTTAAPKSGKSSISVNASGFQAPWVGKPQATPAPQSTRQTPDTLDLYNLRKKEDSGLQGELNKGFGLDWLGTPSAKPEPTPPAPDWFTGAQDFRNRFKNPGTENDSRVTPDNTADNRIRVTPPSGVSPEDFEAQFRGPGETPKAKPGNYKGGNEIGIMFSGGPGPNGYVPAVGGVEIPQQSKPSAARPAGADEVHNWTHRNPNFSMNSQWSARDAAASTPVNQPGTEYQAERDRFRARQIQQQKVNKTIDFLTPSWAKPAQVSPAPRRTPR
jgi:hypothetical protein